MAFGGLIWLFYSCGGCGSLFLMSYMFCCPGIICIICYCPSNFYGSWLFRGGGRKPGCGCPGWISKIGACWIGEAQSHRLCMGKAQWLGGQPILVGSIYLRVGVGPDKALTQVAGKGCRVFTDYKRFESVQNDVLRSVSFSQFFIWHHPCCHLLSRV